MYNDDRALLEQRCALCGAHSRLIAGQLGVCGSCIRTRPEEARPLLEKAHAASRALFKLPETPPRTPGGVTCGLCARDCAIGEGERGYCGLRTVRNGRLVHLAGTPQRGVLHWYRDPLPTNCVADWVCAGHHQRGSHNLAVFYASCTVDCLFCQNWHFREIDVVESEGMSAAELAAVATPRTFCVCFFGGDPASQLPHALAVGRQLARKGVAVCWETNGTMHPRLLDRAVQLSLESGGCIKFDLKAWEENLHFALTGTDNRQVLENFARAVVHWDERPEPPPVIASTLLVPGYVDVEEVGQIARFIADINPDIPYALLGFGPNYLMPDLPPTSVGHAMAAEQAARRAGLRNVRVGNLGLLSQAY
ncbi:MAG TPA: radical SAM protein [Anaerolineae bacterium]|nr:radical SAM protein [Anaerolineae bacterium]HIQ05608.1 radical SAM protein [Anaerolineae bacterium]